MAVDHEPAQDLEKPRSHPLRVAQRAERLQSLEVGFLDEILRGGGVPGETKGQPEEGLEMGERLLLEIASRPCSPGRAAPGPVAHDSSAGPRSSPDSSKGRRSRQSGRSGHVHETGKAAWKFPG